jgi:predicted PurR-regulated permease PerM
MPSTSLNAPLPNKESPAIEPAQAPSPAAGAAIQVGVVVIAALYFGRGVLVPITVAVLLSFLLTPLVNLLRRTRIGRIASVIIAAVVAVGVILGVIGVIGVQLAEIGGRLPQYITTVQTKVHTIQNYATEHLSAITERLGLGQPDENASQAQHVPGDPEAPAARDAAPPPAAQEGISPLEVITNYVSPVLSPFATAGIIFVVAIFVLLQKEDLRDRMIRLFGSSDLHRTTVAMDEAAKRLSRYFLTLLAINVGFGVSIGTGLWFIGVPNPILWMIIGTTLRFVPYVGPIIAASLPIALAAAVDPGWTMALSTVALFIAVELVFNQVVEPIAYGKGTGLSPFAVIVAAIFWGWLWGPVGLILSAPLTLCLVVLGRYVERLEFLDVLLGDRPALTPVESFYQRMLAGDPDEAQEHAELLLKERSLSSYYDRIALKGLQLAANDLARGVLREDQLVLIRETTDTLVAELESHDDIDPSQDAKGGNPAPPTLVEQEIPLDPLPDGIDRAALGSRWSGEAPVLCLAGKGPLDEATSAMLAQIMRKHGLGARVSPYAAASRADIARLETGGVAMVCISYLDIGGSPSHLRYLIRRLRARLPDARILVGLWPAEDKVLADERLQAEIGADYYTTSIREAVNACVSEARRDSAGNADPKITRAEPEKQPALA